MIIQCKCGNYFYADGHKKQCSKCTNPPRFEERCVLGKDCKTHRIEIKY